MTGGIVVVRLAAVLGVFFLRAALIQKKDLRSRCRTSAATTGGRRKGWRALWPSLGSWLWSPRSRPKCRSAPTARWG